MNDWLTYLLEALRRARIDFSPEDVADAVWLTQWLGEAPGWSATAGLQGRSRGRGRLVGALRPRLRF